MIACESAPGFKRKSILRYVRLQQNRLARREGYGGNQVEWTGDEFTSEIAGGRTSRFIRSRPAEPLNEQPFRPGGVLSNQTSRKFECTLSYFPTLPSPPTIALHLPSIRSFFLLRALALRSKMSATCGDALAHLIVVVVVDVVVAQTKDLMHF